MNGRITVELGGLKIALIFGMLAIEEFSRRQSIGGNGIAKISTDLVYAGYCNAEIVAGRNPAFDYGDIADMVDDEIISKGSGMEAIFKCFESSKAGASLMPLTEKKKEEGPVKKKQTKRPTGTK